MDICLKELAWISIRKNALYFMRMIELLKSRIKRMQSAEQNMKKSIHHQEKRCGDEFMAVIYHTGKTEIEELLQSLCREKDRLNSNEAQIPIDYACGWAISTDEETYTLQMLLDKADSDMYENKQLCKKRNLGSRQ